MRVPGARLYETSCKDTTGGMERAARDPGQTGSERYNFIALSGSEVPAGRRGPSRWGITKPPPRRSPPATCAPRLSGLFTRRVRVVAPRRHLPLENVRELPVSWSDPDRNYGEPLPKKLKRDVLRAHAGVCHWCEKPGGDEVDHVVNRRSGGSDDPENLRPIHKYPCHNEKTQQEAQSARRKRTHREPPQHPGRKKPPT